jgi:peptidoglycan/LPS O-acetylase OafA/YrhL
MQRIRSLDGMRAISIIMVLLDHVKHTLPSILIDNYPVTLICDGPLGVEIFFVISGYLITKLFLIEREKKGNINLKDFYLRRIFRIFPVFYLYVIALILLKCFFIPTLFESYTLVGLAAVYLWNYAHLFNIHTSASDNVNWFFGHFWTLSIEEQFYLLWPIMFIKMSNITLKKVVIGIILIIPFIRVATYYLMPGSRGQINMMLQTGGAIIFMGCLGALIEDSSFFRDKILRIINKKSLILFITIYLFIVSPLLYLFAGGIYDVPIESFLNSLCIIILLFWGIHIPSKVSNILNSKVLIQIGILSYSLYIWQQLFLTTNTHFWFNLFPQNLILVFLVALISYYLIERPILRLKKRFESI